MKVTVVLQPEAEGGYSAVVPALPGVVTQGDTMDETLANVLEASLLWLEVRSEDGLQVPVETPEAVLREIEACLQYRSEEGLPLTMETREMEIPAEAFV